MYSATLWVFWGNDSEVPTLVRKTKDKDTDFSFGDCDAYTISKGLKCIIRFKKDPILTPGIVAHELFHVVAHIHKDVGIKLTDDSEESYAYFMGSLTKEFYKHYHKAKKDAVRHNIGSIYPTSNGTGGSILPAQTTI